MFRIQHMPPHPATAQRTGQTAEEFFQQGVQFQRRGMLDEAERTYRLLLASDARHVGCLYNLGTLCAQQGRLDEAVRLFRRALKCDPKFAGAYNNLGNALRGLGRDRDAQKQYEKAIQLEPGFAEAHNNLANVLQALGRPDGAAEHFRTAIRLKPDFPDAHANLGRLLTAEGRIDEAAGHFRRAAELVPRNGSFFRRLARLKRFTADDPDLARMRALANDADSLGPTERMELHFALGKALGDVAEYEESFRHILAGNALQRQQTPYHEAEGLALFDKIRAAFTPELMQARRDEGAPSSVPIFILGMPRSGSTLVEQILASHKQVHGAGEIDDFTAELSHLAGPKGRVAFPEDIPALPGSQFRRLGAAYLASIRATAPEAARIVDKTPGNFHFAGLIHLALPGAKIIHTRRDPVDTCFSCFSRLFVDMHPTAYSLPELGRYYRAYEGLMEHWRRVLPEGVMLEVRYEDVVEDLEGQARRILAHCGLDWDPAVLSFHETRRSVHTASAAQVRQPLFRSSIGVAQPYLPWLGPLIDELNAP